MMSLTFETNAPQNALSMSTIREMRRQFGERLRLVRKAAGYETAREFAIAIDIDESALSNYERGLRRPPNDVLARIRDRTKVTADYLYFGDPSGLPVMLYAKLRAMPGHVKLEERKA